MLVPPSLGEQDLEKEKKKETFEVRRDKHELPKWISALNAHKENLTILQGLSGKMCTTGHHTWQSSLGVYAANERRSSIKSLASSKSTVAHIGDVISQYLAYLKVEGRRASTLKRYTPELERIRKFAEDQGVTRLNGISITLLDEYRAWRTKRGGH